MYDYDDNDQPTTQDYDIDDISIYKEWRDTDSTITRVLNQEENDDLFKFCL